MNCIDWTRLIPVLIQCILLVVLVIYMTIPILDAMDPVSMAFMTTSVLLGFVGMIMVLVIQMGRVCGPPNVLLLMAVMVVLLTLIVLSSIVAIHESEQDTVYVSPLMGVEMLNFCAFVLIQIDRLNAMEGGAATQPQPQQEAYVRLDATEKGKEDV